MKLKEVHVVNTSPVIETLLNFIKPFLKDKIKNRVSMAIINIIIIGDIA